MNEKYFSVLDPLMVQNLLMLNNFSSLLDEEFLGRIFRLILDKKMIESEVLPDVLPLQAVRGNSEAELKIVEIVEERVLKECEMTEANRLVFMMEFLRDKESSRSSFWKKAWETIGEKGLESLTPQGILIVLETLKVKPAAPETLDKIEEKISKALAFIEEFELRSDFDTSIKLLYLLGERGLASDSFQTSFCQFLQKEIPNLHFDQVAAAFKLVRVHCQSHKIEEFKFAEAIADKVKTQEHNLTKKSAQMLRKGLEGLLTEELEATLNKYS